MRHSVSIPFNALLATHEVKASGAQGTYTTLLGKDELRKAIVRLLDKPGRNGEEVVERILQGEQPVVASCGSGMTAAVIWLALQEMGVNRTVPLYDEVSLDNIIYCSPNIRIAIGSIRPIKGAPNRVPLSSLQEPWHPLRRQPSVELPSRPLGPFLLSPGESSACEGRRGRMRPKCGTGVLMNFSIFVNLAVLDGMGHAKRADLSRR